MPTKLINCTCKHDYQEKTYGKTLRLANACKAPDGRERYRCTVCGKTVDQTAKVG